MANQRALRTTVSTVVVMAGLSVASLLVLPAAASNASAATAHRTASHKAARSGWFHDPISAAARQAEIAVPADPAGYTGARRHTVAAARTHSGAIAVPVKWARGHQVVKGEALALTNGSLFVFNSATITTVARAELARLSASLTLVTSVRCEGYTDFGGAASHERSLSVQRAQAVCALVQRHRHGISTTSVGYGGTRPVIVGGSTDNRVENRRVVIAVTASTPLPPAPTAPSAPRLTTATAGDAVATITFSKPAHNGGDPITGYQVSTNAGTSWHALASKGASPFQDTLHNLTNDTTYVVSVRASNAVGHGNASNRLRVTPQSQQSVTVASQPTLTSVASGNGIVTVTFAAPTSDGGAAISGYEISLVEGQDIWVPITTTGSSPFTVVITGLTNGVKYPFVVRAINSVGASEPSNSMNMTPRPTAPAAPLLISVSPGNGFASAAFAAGADNGAVIKSYQASTDDGVTWHTVITTGADPIRANLSNLTDGTPYTVLVRAVNSAGASAASNAIMVTPFAEVPDAPTLDSVMAGDGNANATFTAPASDGGAAISGYEVSTVDGQDVWVAAATTGTSPFTVTISDLTDGITYPVVVRAVNSAGKSLPSNSLSVTPAAAPVVASAPTILSGTANYGLSFIFPTIATLTFSTPTSDGGSAITSYQISADAGMSWQPVTYTAGTPNQLSVFAGYGCGAAAVTNNYEIRAETLAGDGVASADYPMTFYSTTCGGFPGMG
jgi:outer membrane protein OmpA-like peptidoglycan-associated protein